MSLVGLLLSVLCAHGVYSLPDLSRLKRDLISAYNPNIIPLSNQTPTTPVEVRLQFSLIKLLDVDEDEDEVEVLAWVMYSWKDFALAWSPELYGNLESIRLPQDHVWNPDITLYNAVKAPEVTTPKLVVIYHNGDVTYIPGVRLRFSCDLSGVDSDSGAECTMKYGSWTYDASKITLPKPNDDDLDLNNYFPTRKYSILNTSAKKNILTYDCCPESYESLKFTFTIKRKCDSVLPCFV